MTVIADSAMISDDNIKFLQAEKLDYIVAARTANLPIQTIEKTDLFYGISNRQIHQNQTLNQSSNQGIEKIN